MEGDVQRKQEERSGQLWQGWRVVAELNSWRTFYWGDLSKDLKVTREVAIWLSGVKMIQAEGINRVNSFSQEHWRVQKEWDACELRGISEEENRRGDNWELDHAGPLDNSKNCSFYSKIFFSKMGSHCKILRKKDER